MSQNYSTCVYLGAKLASYGFGKNHPFGPDRHHSFEIALKQQHLDEQVAILPPVSTDRQMIELFHDRTYVDRVIEQSNSGQGFLDYGDTPAFR